jgi:hypothetical protein
LFWLFVQNNSYVAFADFLTSKNPSDENSLEGKKVKIYPLNGGFAEFS